MNLNFFLNLDWEAKDLTVDHKPWIYEEAERIEISGGRLYQSKNEEGRNEGPLKLKLNSKEMSGLKMTRSFGDYFAREEGLISNPGKYKHIIY